MLRRGDIISLLSKMIQDTHDERQDLFDIGQGQSSRGQKLGKRLAGLYEVKSSLARLPTFLSSGHVIADALPPGPELNERAALAVRDSGCEPESIKAVFRLIGDIRIPIEDLREFEFSEDGE